MKIAMIGTGYVGLVTGACLAKIGHRVTCVDMDEAKVLALSKGEIPIFEPGLAEVVQQASQKQKIAFTTDFDAAVQDCDVIFIAVGGKNTLRTPCRWISSKAASARNFSNRQATTATILRPLREPTSSIWMLVGSRRRTIQRSIPQATTATAVATTRSRPRATRRTSSQ